jgi:hypothetical protein
VAYIGSHGRGRRNGRGLVLFIVPGIGTLIPLMEEQINTFGNSVKQFTTPDRGSASSLAFFLCAR